MSLNFPYAWKKIEPACFVFMLKIIFINSFITLSSSKRRANVVFKNISEIFFLKYIYIYMKLICQEVIEHLNAMKSKKNNF